MYDYCPMGIGLNILYRSPVAFVASAALASVLAACAPSTGYAPDASPTLSSSPSVSAAHNDGDAEDPDGFAYRAAEITVREGLNSITQRYIDPVNMDELALGGLRGLATIDPNLQMEMDTGSRKLHLNRGTVHLAHLTAPGRGEMDASAWARLTADVLRTGRTYSPDLQSADNERVYEAVFDGMLSNLDIFSRYAGAEEARANRARRDGFGGIGIRFTKADDGILVTHVSSDSPAMDAGLKPGDVIVRVNNDETARLKLRDVAKMLRGPVGSLINLSVTRLTSDATAPERKIDFNLKRAHIVPETVRVVIDGSLMILNVSSFNKNTSSAMHDILRANDRAMRDGAIQGIVMDLRGNPGGLLSQAVNVADLFLNKGRIIATQGRHPDSHHDYRAGGVDLARNLPLVILVDGNSASAAEIVASALQDLGRAVVIGSTSYGKGTVQTVIRLPNDGEVTLTWSRFVSPSGYAIHGLGVMPAVCATNTDTSGAPAPAGQSATQSTPGTQSAEALTDAILAPDHIDAARDAMDAWRAAGLIFDGRRNTLRNSCPARAFTPGENGDLLMKLAGRVIRDPSLYQRALFLSQPVSTASR